MSRPRSDERARRLIAVLGRLRPGDRIPLAELAEQLGVTPAEVGADVVTLSLCGVAPYDPFALVPVMIDGDVVEVFGEIPALHGPVRLSAAEAGALAAALQAAGFTAEDPLTARILEAASASFDAPDLERVVRTAASTHDSGVYECVARALRDRLVVRIDYARTGSTESTVRDVEPFALFAERGTWYLTAWCRSAASWRTFRIDRIRAANLTEERAGADRPARPATTQAFDPNDLPLARLRFIRAEDFSIRDWPGAQVVSTSDHEMLVDVPYAGTDWVARRVVARLGAVEVLSPPEVRETVALLARDLCGRGA